MSNLKIIPLGGLGEIGKNMTVFEYGRDIIIIDCGMGFPDDDLYGVDYVIPDITYLRQNKEKIRGIVITHGHEDHIGAIPFLLPELDVPVFATPLSAGIIELRLEESDLLTNTQIFTKKVGDKFKLGAFEIEFINVNHSIADAVALAIKTPIGTVVHTGDFKIDLTPVKGEMIDLARFGELGNRGVLALLSDSTNVEKPGHTISELKVSEKFDELFKGCKKRIIVTTFASNIQRIQQIIRVAAKYGRKVAVNGRSMERMMAVACALEYMDIPEGTLIDIKDINSLPKDQICILSTGSQGERMSALYRMAFSEHKQIKIDYNDRVIISASAIPGNETTISKVIDALFQNGAEVIYDKHTDLHVSGHASQEELKIILSLVKPKFFIPVHGEYRMLYKHALLARTMGVESTNTILADNGSVIDITKNSIKIEKLVKAGPVYVDGENVGEIDTSIINDRRKLAQNGIIVILLNVYSETKELVSNPDLFSKGFNCELESVEIKDEINRVIAESFASCKKRKILNPISMTEIIKTNLSGFIYKISRQSPIILLHINEI